MTDNSLLSNAQNITPEVTTSMVNILCEFGKDSKAKPKAKLCLMDFGRIANGEMTPEALLAYSAA
jgi:hypothetical protein